MALSKGSRDNGKPGTERALSDCSLLQLLGRRHHPCSPTLRLIIPLGRPHPQRKLSNSMRVEESSKARIQEIHEDHDWPRSGPGMGPELGVVL